MLYGWDLVGFRSILMWEGCARVGSGELLLIYGGELSEGGVVKWTKKGKRGCVCMLRPFFSFC
jgi:hypothetical protein